MLLLLLFVTVISISYNITSSKIYRRAYLPRLPPSVRGYLRRFEPEAGFEPATANLQEWCSSNWATPAWPHYRCGARRISTGGYHSLSRIRIFALAIRLTGNSIIPLYIVIIWLGLQKGTDWRSPLKPSMSGRHLSTNLIQLFLFALKSQAFHPAAPGSPDKSWVRIRYLIIRIFASLSLHQGFLLIPIR